MADDVGRVVAVVELRFEDADALARDLRTGEAADQLLALPAEHRPADDLEPTVVKMRHHRCGQEPGRRTGVGAARAPPRPGGERRRRARLRSRYGLLRLPATLARDRALPRPRREPRLPGPGSLRRGRRGRRARQEGAAGRGRGCCRRSGQTGSRTSSAMSSGTSRSSRRRRGSTSTPAPPRTSTSPPRAPPAARCTAPATTGSCPLHRGCERQRIRRAVRVARRTRRPRLPPPAAFRSGLAR